MEEWDIYELGDNECVFYVKNLESSRLLYAMAAVKGYINQYAVEDNRLYDLMFYAERIYDDDLNEYLIFTDLPYSRFVMEEPNFKFERKDFYNSKRHKRKRVSPSKK
jgi:hypothetical protein